MRRGAQTDFYDRMNSGRSSEYLVNARRQLLCDLDAAFRLQLSTSLIIIDPNGTGRRLLMDDVLKSYNLISTASINQQKASSASHSDQLVTSISSQSTRNYVGYVNSELLETDAEALIDLAGQFMFRNEKRESSSYTKALEDLENHFRQCRSEERPAVVVLEGFDKYANRRQTLIYTLLDLMHKADLLFIMIGITARADVQYILEKRVLSRLNAQFVYVDTPTAEDIAKELYSICVLPIKSEYDATTSDYRLQFNKHIIELFGEYSDSHLYTTCTTASTTEPSILSGGESSPRSSTLGSPLLSQRSVNSVGTPLNVEFTSPINESITRSSERSSAKKQRDVVVYNSSGISSSVKKKKVKLTQDSPAEPQVKVQSDTMNINDYMNKSKDFSASSSGSKVGVYSSSSRDAVTLVRSGMLLKTIRVYKEWGFGIDDFIRTIQFSIMGLTDESPYITKDVFMQSMAQQMPSTIAESMSYLDEMELYLLAAMCYLHLHETTADHFTIAALVTNYDRMTSNLKNKRVQKLHLVAAINSLCNKEFIQLFNTHSGIKCANQSGITSITNQTIVFLTASVYDIRKAFLNKHLKSSTINNVECRRTQPTIRIQERIRHLLENPTSNNLYCS